MVSGATAVSEARLSMTMPTSVMDRRATKVPAQERPGSLASRPTRPALGRLARPLLSSSLSVCRSKPSARRGEHQPDLPSPGRQSTRSSLPSLAPPNGTVLCRGGGRHFPSRWVTAGGTRRDTAYRPRCDICDISSANPRTDGSSDAEMSAGRVVAKSRRCRYPPRWPRRLLPARALARLRPDGRGMQRQTRDKTGENECAECSPPSGWLD